MGSTWDSVPIADLKAEELRNDSFDIFREKAILSRRIDEDALEMTNAQLLESLQLMENGLLKRAAVLLFHHKPERWIPGAFIKIGYFASDDALLYQDEVHGSLLAQAEKTIDLIYTKYLKASISYNGINRVETYPFPKEAIREAVLNAIAHKYYGALIPIQISVYADKLYIANDCIFPEDWTVASLFEKHRSRPYNPLVASTLYRAGFIESWGRGIEKIKKSCEEAGNPLPVYSIKQGDIMVMFRCSDVFMNKQAANQAADQATDQAANQTALNETERAILRAISDNQTLSQREIAALLHRSLSTVKFYMEKMKKNQIIARDGSSQKGKWLILIK